MNEIIINKIRVQFLTESIIRIEKELNGKFEDRPTFFVPNRESFLGEEIIKKEKRNVIILSLGEFSFELNKSQESVFGIKVYKQNELIYVTKRIKNTGELPSLDKTPIIYPFIDSPRLILPKHGYSVKATELGEKYEISENVEDLYLLLSEGDMLKLRSLYIQVSGPTEKIRYGTLGYILSRYYKYDEKSAKEIVLQCQKHNLPLDNLVIDTDWREANDIGIGYTIAKDLFPDMKGFLAWCHEQGVETIFNDHPEPVKGAVNAFDPVEIKFREPNLKHILDIGLDDWWYDRNWTCKLVSPSKNIEPETIGLYLFSNVTTLKHQEDAKNNKIYRRPDIIGNVNNIYHGHYKDILDSASHRYSLQWTGDITSSLDSLGREVRNIVKGTASEISYISADIGGHIGDPDKNDYLKWVTFGCFSPIFRPHSTKHVIRFREPWNYDQETVDVFRNYLNARIHLLPYIYSEFDNNYVTGKPAFGSIGFNYQEDKKALKLIDEYMIGNNILVAPYCAPDTVPFKKKYFLGEVKVKWYKGTNLEGKPIFEETLDDVNFKFGTGGKYNDIVGSIKFSGRYEFTYMSPLDELWVASDDGVRVYVDGKLCLDDWHGHAVVTQKVGSFDKNKPHKVVLEYFQDTNGAELYLLCRKSAEEKPRKVYLPNDEWINPFNGKIIEGSRNINWKVDARLLPMFIRRGSIFPLGYTSKNAKEQSLKKLIYDYYPSFVNTDEGYLYEDDRITTAYKYGESRISNYRASYNKKDNAFVIELDKSIGTFRGKYNVKERNVMLKVHLFKDIPEIKEVLINGVKVNYKLHKKNKAAFPFNDSERSADSKTLTIKFKQNVINNYNVIIKLY